MWIALIAIALGLWTLLGSPTRTIADKVWGDEPAPWETVDAIYYPDRSDLTAYKMEVNIGSVEACRDWANEQAADNNDEGLRRGDYTCAIGRTGKTLGDLPIYRRTVH